MTDNRRRSVRLMIMTVVMMVLPFQNLFAESGDAAHGALLFTSILTLVLVAVIFFLLVLPEEKDASFDRRRPLGCVPDVMQLTHFDARVRLEDADNPHRPP